jgi:hypothetical protein
VSVAREYSLAPSTSERGVGEHEARRLADSKRQSAVSDMWVREYDRVMDIDLQKFDGWLPCGPF